MFFAVVIAPFVFSKKIGSGKPPRVCASYLVDLLSHVVYGKETPASGKEGTGDTYLNYDFARGGARGNVHKTC